MPRGGKRVGAGRPKGAKNFPSLQLVSEQVAQPIKHTAAERMLALKRRVAVLVADNMPESDIAAVMGLPIERLRALFAHELTHGRALFRAEVLERLDAAGEAGSVSADKTLEALTGAPSTASKLGKKAAALAGAREATANGSRFSTMAPPPIGAAPAPGNLSAIAHSKDETLQ